MLSKKHNRKMQKVLICGLVVLVGANAIQTLASKGSEDLSPFFSPVAEFHNFLYSLPFMSNDDWPDYATKKQKEKATTPHVMRKGENEDDKSSREAFDEVMNASLKQLLLNTFQTYMDSLPLSKALQAFDILSYYEGHNPTESDGSALLHQVPIYYESGKQMTRASNNLVLPPGISMAVPTYHQMGRRITESQKQIQYQTDSSSKERTAHLSPDLLNDICDLRYQNLFRNAWKQFFDVAEQHSQEWQPWFGDSFRNIWGNFHGAIEDSLIHLTAMCQDKNKATSDFSLPTGKGSAGMKTLPGRHRKEAIRTPVCEKAPELLGVATTNNQACDRVHRNNYNSHENLSGLFEKLNKSLWKTAGSMLQRQGYMNSGLKQKKIATKYVPYDEVHINSGLKEKKIATKYVSYDEVLLRNATRFPKKFKMRSSKAFFMGPINYRPRTAKHIVSDNTKDCSAPESYMPRKDICRSLANEGTASKFGTIKSPWKRSGNSRGTNKFCKNAYRNQSREFLIKVHPQTFLISQSRPRPKSINLTATPIPFVYIKFPAAGAKKTDNRISKFTNHTSYPAYDKCHFNDRLKKQIMRTREGKLGICSAVPAAKTYYAKKDMVANWKLASSKFYNCTVRSAPKVWYTDSFMVSRKQRNGLAKCIASPSMKTWYTDCTASPYLKNWYSANTKKPAICTARQSMTGLKLEAATPSSALFSLFLFVPSVCYLTCFLLIFNVVAISAIDYHLRSTKKNLRDFPPVFMRCFQQMVAIKEAWLLVMEVLVVSLSRRFTALKNAEKEEETEKEYDLCGYTKSVETPTEEVMDMDAHDFIIDDESIISLDDESEEDEEDVMVDHGASLDHSDIEDEDFVLIDEDTRNAT